MFWRLEVTVDLLLLGVERGVEAGELEVGAIPQPVKQSGQDGRRLETVMEALVDVEVVSIWARSSLPSESALSWFPMAGKIGTRAMARR